MRRELEALGRALGEAQRAVIVVGLAVRATNEGEERWAGDNVACAETRTRVHGRTEAWWAWEARARGRWTLASRLERETEVRRALQLALVTVRLPVRATHGLVLLGAGHEAVCSLRSRHVVVARGDERDAEQVSQDGHHLGFGGRNTRCWGERKSGSGGKKWCVLAGR